LHYGVRAHHDKEIARGAGAHATTNAVWNIDSIPL
jgi:hypothetical protein